MKYLLIGHWAREYSIAKRLKDEWCRVYGILSRRNSELQFLLNGFQAVPHCWKKFIEKYSIEKSIDVIFPTSEDTIFAGVGDIPFPQVFGPWSKWSWLERDKFFCKSVVKTVAPHAVSNFIQCQSFQDYSDFCSFLSDNIVMKTPWKNNNIFFYFRSTIIA